MRERYKIKVRDESGETIAEIKRVLRAEQIGNFNPIFCTYHGERYLVRSELGDLSDPFRRSSAYLAELYIIEKAASS